MKHSESRILTTHAGSLPRPDELLPVNLEAASEPERDPSAHRQRLRAAVQEVVHRQINAGIAVVNDGEYGKAMRAIRDYGAWLVYVMQRLTGYEPAAGENAGEPVTSVKPRSFYQRRDRLSFPEVYAEIDQEMYGGRPRPMGRADGQRSNLRAGRKL